MSTLPEVERRQIPLLDVGKPIERQRSSGELIDVTTAKLSRGVVDCPQCGRPAIPFRLGWDWYHFAHQVYVRGTIVEQGSGCRASWSPKEVRR